MYEFKRFLLCLVTAVAIVSAIGLLILGVVWLLSNGYFWVMVVVLVVAFITGALMDSPAFKDMV